MVVHLEALPPELQTRIVGICDAAAAGAFARLSSACRLLVATHLAALLVAHRQVLSDAAALELQQAFATRAAPALLEVNDMGGGQLSVRVVTRDIQLRAVTTRFSCECCGHQGSCGIGFSNLQRHLASKTHWTAHRLRVHNLPFDNAAWHAFAVRLPSRLISP